MKEVMFCPFCGAPHAYQFEGAAPSGAVAEFTVLSIECPCGATYALERGNRVKCAALKE